jgi:hypothetical protein
MSIADELRHLHELHQRGALTDEEFSRAKARVLNPNPSASEQELRDEIHRLRVQARLDKLDQEWNTERVRFLVQFGNQERQPLSRRMITVIVGGGLGVAGFFLALSFAMRAPFFVVPALGVVFVSAIVGFTWYQRVTEYEELYQSYRQRRATLLADMPEAADTAEAPIALEPRLAAHLREAVTRDKSQ